MIYAAFVYSLDIVAPHSFGVACRQDVAIGDLSPQDPVIARPP